MPGTTGEARIIDGLAQETADLGVEIVDVAGDIEKVSQQIAQQAEAFRGMVRSAGQVNDSNSRIATAAGQAREKASQTAESVRNSDQTVQTAVKDIHETEIPPCRGTARPIADRRPGDGRRPVRHGVGSRRQFPPPVSILQSERVMHEDVLLAVLVEIHQPGVFLVVG